MPENASGMRSLEALISAFFARPKTIGRKNAVEAVLLMTDPRPAETTITIRYRRSGSLPVWRSTARPVSSTTPVRSRAAVRMSSPRIMITASLPKPSKALSFGRSPVNTSASSTPSATTSAAMRSQENNARAAARMQSSRAIWKFMPGKTNASPITYRTGCGGARLLLDYPDHRVAVNSASNLCSATRALYISIVAGADAAAQLSSEGG